MGTLGPVERRAMKDLLRGLVPIERSAKQLEFQAMVTSSQGPALQPEARFEEFPKYVSRDSTYAVSFKKESTVVETTYYDGWETFRNLATEALRVREAVTKVDGVERIGLRYINEIRVPEESSSDWSDWVSSSVLAPNGVDKDINLPISQWQGVGVYGSQPGQALVLRYGPRDGYAVENDLKRSFPKAGPFMWIDMDSFWTPDEDGTPEFSLDSIVSISNQLHVPIRELFESLITDRLRNEVLRSV